MAFCSKCGGAVNEGARFCSHCGAAIGTLPQEAAAQPIQDDVQSEQVKEATVPSGEGQYQGQGMSPQPQPGGGQYQGQGMPQPQSGGGQYQGQGMPPQPQPGGGQYQGQGMPPQPQSGDGQYQGQGMPPQPQSGGGQYQGQGMPPQPQPGGGVQYGQGQVQQPYGQMSGQQQNTGQSNFTSRVASLNNTADTTGEFDPHDVQSNKAMAILSYLGILVLIPLLAAKESRFARFHANQGLILCITEVVYAVLYGVISAVIFTISWRLYFLISIIGLLGLVFLVLAILGIINAAGGKAKELPVIGKFRLLK